MRRVSQITSEGTNGEENTLWGQCVPPFCSQTALGSLGLQTDWASWPSEVSAAARAVGRQRGLLLEHGPVLQRTVIFRGSLYSKSIFLGRIAKIVLVCPRSNESTLSSQLML